MSDDTSDTKHLTCLILGKYLRLESVEEFWKFEDEALHEIMGLLTIENNMATPVKNLTEENIVMIALLL